MIAVFNRDPLKWQFWDIKIRDPNEFISTIRSFAHHMKFIIAGPVLIVSGIVNYHSGFIIECRLDQTLTVTVANSCTIDINGIGDLIRSKVSHDCLLIFSGISKAIFNSLRIICKTITNSAECFEICDRPRFCNIVCKFFICRGSCLRFSGNL